MRLWSLHPRYLDARGLVAAWREALLAQAVLAARTRGYREHPQLVRFRAHAEPARAIAAYLRGLHAESVERGYRFDAGRIAGCDAGRVPVTRGQIAFERTHLLAKLRVRDPDRAARLRRVRSPAAHPLFRVVPGGIEPWERAAGALPPLPEMKLLPPGPTREALLQAGHSTARQNRAEEGSWIASRPTA